uniref:Leucine-rich repeat domain-containing protein n=1 Tax=Schlesneria paludicola TaxID=360056 RepID=A0A7C4LML9_9PLAN
MRGWTVLLGAAFVTGAVFAQDKPAEKPQPTEAQKQAIAQIKKLGGLVLELAQNDPRLDVAFHLADVKITDAELALVKPLTQTAHLNLRGTEITDAGLAHLAELKGLVRLHLEKTKITDAGLEHLRGLENLEYLNLYGTAVSDAGLKHLEGLKKLKKLYLWQTQVTDAGVAALKQALPELQITRGLELAKPAEPDKKPEEKKE